MKVSNFFLVKFIYTSYSPYEQVDEYFEVMCEHRLKEVLDRKLSGKMLCEVHYTLCSYVTGEWTKLV